MKNEIKENMYGIITISIIFLTGALIGGFINERNNIKDEAKPKIHPCGSNKARAINEYIENKLTKKNIDNQITTYSYCDKNNNEAFDLHIKAIYFNDVYFANIDSDMKQYEIDYNLENMLPAGINRIKGKILEVTNEK